MANTAAHPNRLGFTGILTFVNQPSDRAPSGARGHRVNLTCDAVEKALPGLIGMGVDYRSDWCGHDAKRKIGTITGAKLAGVTVLVDGFLYARDFPEVIQEIQARTDDVLGMSFELADAHVDDMRAEVWTLSRVTFTGAAVLLRTMAAYKSTNFQLEADSENLSTTRQGVSGFNGGVAFEHAQTDSGTVQRCAGPLRHTEPTKDGTVSSNGVRTEADVNRLRDTGLRVSRATDEGQAGRVVVEPVQPEKGGQQLIQTRIFKPFEIVTAFTAPAPPVREWAASVDVDHGGWKFVAVWLCVLVVDGLLALGVFDLWRFLCR